MKSGVKEVFTFRLFKKKMKYRISSISGQSRIFNFLIDRHNKHQLMYLYRSNKIWAEYQAFKELDVLGKN